MFQIQQLLIQTSLLRSIVCLVLTSVLLAGCVGTGKPAPAPAERPGMSAMDAEALLTEAARLASPARENLQLQAAEILWSVSDRQPEQQHRALSLLLNIDPAKLSDRHFASYTLLYGRWAFDKEQADLARKILVNARIESLLQELDINQTTDLHELRARFFIWDRQPIRAINERITLTTLLVDANQQEKNQEALWITLQQLTADELEQLNSNSDKQLKAWIELSRITTAQELDLDAQATQLDEWLDRYPRHPAAQNLPPELRLLQSAIKQRPQNVTLLLPLSGNLQEAGEAVRDGFMAAYYQAMKRGYPLPQVHVVDSQQGSNFLDLYDQVAASNTDLIIGPLEKEKVALLQDKWRIPVPTLALNDAAGSTADKTTSNLYLFSLNPEDEAHQAAQEARQQHYERALVIAPTSDWGQRLSNAFFTEWTAQGGTALATIQFDSSKDDYSTVIQQALGISDSKNRKLWLRQWTAESLEFEPRRRQDIDVIFLAARPDAARQIKPLLAFHYAGQIPVYAGSSIYSGQTTPEKDADLDGIHLLVTPWLFENSELKNEVDARLTPDTGFQSLYALGADAWRLHARLPLLSADTRSRLHGYTGILSLDSKQRIYRQQIWATINKGYITVPNSSTRP